MSRVACPRGKRKPPRAADSHSGISETSAARVASGFPRGDEAAPGLANRQTTSANHGKPNRAAASRLSSPRLNQKELWSAEPPRPPIEITVDCRGHRPRILAGGERISRRAIGVAQARRFASARLLGGARGRGCPRRSVVSRGERHASGDNALKHERYEGICPPIAFSSRTQAATHQRRIVRSETSMSSAISFSVHPW